MHTASLIADVEAFHAKFQLSYIGPPRMLPDDMRVFRIKFLREEIDEFAGSFNHADRFDALIDLVYVTIGTAHLHGFAEDLSINVNYSPKALATVSYRSPQALHYYCDHYRSARTIEQCRASLICLMVKALHLSADFSYPFLVGWSRVHAANMTKIRVLRIEDSKRSSLYDVLKPPGFVPPDLSDLVT